MKTELRIYKSISKEVILDAVRSEAKEAGDRSLRLNHFIARTKVTRSVIRRIFGGWRNALAMAGLDSEQQRRNIEGDVLLRDWGRVARKSKRAPTYLFYKEHGEYSTTTFQDRFGSWLNVRQAFRAFAEGKSEWADVANYCEPSPRMRRKQLPRNPLPRRMRRQNAPGRPREDRPSFGEPVDNVPGLLNAPLTENGVILIFGMLSERLGFHIRAVRPSFPDCLAMRWVGKTSWQEVRIEFEFESRNFRDHKHPPDGCDILVCWVHNWEDCPPNLEVIALSEELERLREHSNDAGACAN